MEMNVLGEVSPFHFKHEDEEEIIQHATIVPTELVL